MMNSGFEECPHCGRSFKRAGGGITIHIKACERKAQREQENKAILARAFQDRQGRNKLYYILLA
jgi:hypothetical protein